MVRKQTTVIVVEGGPCGNVPFGVDFSERQHGRDAGVAVAEDVRPVVAVIDANASVSALRISGQRLMSFWWDRSAASRPSLSSSSA